MLLFLMRCYNLRSNEMNFTKVSVLMGLRKPLVNYKTAVGDMHHMGPDRLFVPLLTSKAEYG